MDIVDRIADNVTCPGWSGDSRDGARCHDVLVSSFTHRSIELTMRTPAFSMASIARRGYATRAGRTPLVLTPAQLKALPQVRLVSPRCRDTQLMLVYHGAAGRFLAHA